MAQKATLKRKNFGDQQMIEFRPGDLAVYPAHGVGRIESIESKEIGGKKQDFYFMHIFETNMVIMIPTKNAGSVGLRNIVDLEDIHKIYEVIQSKSEKRLENHPWNFRQKDYMDKIKTGSLYEVAKVFRDLYRLKNTKKLSFGEKKLFETARGLLLKELSAAKKKDEKHVLTEIESLFTPA